MADIIAGTEDSEVKKIMSNPSVDPEDDTFLPPGSPVLSNNFNNITRKLANKRIFKRKSRVKLTDRFNAESAIEPLDTQIRKFHEESFTSSQANNLAACLEKIETIEHNRQLWYNMMVKNKQNDSCFKKPLSVTCSRSHRQVNDSVDSNNMVIQNYEQLHTNLPPINLPSCSSFQTATGKSMQISGSDIRKQALMFEDIYEPTLGGNMCKVKQYNFLKKSAAGQKGENGNARNFNTCGVVVDNINISKESKIETSMIEKKVASHNCVELEILKDAQCSTPTTSEDPEAFSKNTSISLTQEISKSGISNTQMLSIVEDYSVIQNISNTDDSEQHKKESNNMSITLSQQIGESSISNTQIISIIEDHLNKGNYSQSKYKEQHIFVGFSKNDIEQSNSCVHSLSNAIKKISTTNRSNGSENVSRKRVLELDRLPSSKKIKLNPFPNNYSNLTSGCGGFSSASGKHINVTSKALAKASHIFDNMNYEIGNPEIDKTVKRADADNLKELKSIPKLSSRLQECDLEIVSSKKQAVNLQKTAIILGEVVQKAEVAHKSNSDNDSLSDNMNFKVNNENAHPGFATASGKLMMMHENSKVKAKQVFGDILGNTPDYTAAKIMSKNKLKLLDDAIKKAEVTSIPYSTKELPKDLDSVQSMSSEKIGFTNASGKVFQVSESSLAKAKQMFGDLTGNEAESANRLASKNKFKLLDEAIKKTEMNMGLQPSSVEDDFKKSNFKNKALPKLSLQHRSPLQHKLLRGQIAENCNVHTPKKEDVVLKKAKRKLGISSCKQIRISEQNLEKAKLLFDQEVQSISPIKPIEVNIQQRFTTPVRLEGSFSRTDRKFCSTPLQNNLNTLNNLPVSSPIISARSMPEEDPKLDPDSFFVFGAPTKTSISDWVQKYGEERRLLEERLEKIKDREAVLFKLHQSKMNDKRPCLGVLYRKKKLSGRLNLRLLCDEISHCEDKNQDLFFVSPKNSANFHFKCDTVSKTEDGATIIPNLEDLVGLSEIQLGIETMAGVEARLIPKDWIKNHYKWIVWKLASYERNFPNKCKCILSIENVVQQLKYRYDREIDKVERSALRRILERDDAPQKRIVLCVSAIKRKDLTKYELELTDGWYAVRTVIDEPLCAQVYRKIQIGTKLITCGAELLNCDGCHPLEASDLVCLRINYNNTRRACWYTKLGYQKYPQPFPVKICSIHPSGGIVGAIKICVIRVYPLKFLEKLGTNSVWRNKKAEEKRAQEWENEICRKIEKTKDSQGARNEINNLITRDVSVVLRLQVIDVLDTEHRTYNFHVWMPSENHLQNLREGKSMTVYNVLPKKNGDLSSCAKTLFKPMDSKQNMPGKFLRKLTLIEDISPELMADFMEFDTVGVIVQTVIEDNFQKVWIAGLSGRLLLIRINEGPKLCSLLDHAKRGQPMAVSNLLLSLSSKFDILQASANHYSVFSLYPMQKHLQNGLDAFRKELGQDLDVLLNDCDKKIELFDCRESIKLTSLSKLDDSDEDTLTTTRLTSTDVALSLIDMDKFI